MTPREDIDTSDIPEEGKEFFARARLTTVASRRLEFEIGDTIAAIISHGPGMDIRKYAIKLAAAIDGRIKELIDRHPPRKPK